ncbi:uncharacterized protein LOC144452398 [Glandiceps talaboti]
MGSAPSKPVPPEFRGFDRNDTVIDMKMKSLSKLDEYIARFSKLTTLILQDNILSSLPQQLSSLKKLSILDLSLNRFKDIPSVVFELAELSELDMDGNEVTEVPLAVVNLTKLKSLSLQYNMLQSVPIELYAMESIKNISVTGNKLSSLPAKLHKVLKKRSVNRTVLSDNAFEEIPLEVCSLRHLVELTMDKNSIKGIPAEIGKLTKLNDVNLSHNSITKIPPELCTLKRLTELSLGNNKITEVPCSIGDLRQLKSLKLGGNKLKTLPLEMASLTLISNLDLAHNDMEELPMVVTSLKGLEKLEVGSNHIKDLPDEIGQLHVLVEFGLGDNLIGDEALGKLMSLQRLEKVKLEDNCIHNIPRQFTEKLTNLKGITLYGNTVEDLPPALKRILVKEETASTDWQCMNGGDDSALVDDDGGGRRIGEIGSFGNRTMLISMKSKEKRTYGISHSFTLEVPEGVDEKREADTEDVVIDIAYIDMKQANKDTTRYKLALKADEEQESEIIDINPRDIGIPVTLVLKLDKPENPSRQLVIMESENGKKWNEITSKQEGSYTKAELKRLSIFVAITKPLTDDIKLKSEGGKFSSSVIPKLTVDFPKGAVDTLGSFVMEADITEDSSNEQDTQPDVVEDITVSPVLYLRGSDGKKHLSFKEDVTVTLPSPPNLRGRRVSDTAIRVLRDADENNNWTDITDSLLETLRVLPNGVVSFRVNCFSGHIAARTQPLKRNRAPSHISNIRRNQQIRRKHGSFKVNIILLQSKKDQQSMIINLVSSQKLQEKRRELIDSGYDSPVAGRPYTRDIKMKKGDTVNFDVSEDFKLTNESRVCTFYPNRDNTYHAYVVVPRDRRPEEPEDRVGFVKFYTKQSGHRPEVLAELPFQLHVNVEPELLQRRISNYPDDGPVITDFDFYFNLLAGILLTSYNALIDFGERLGLTPEEIYKSKCAGDLRQQTFKMLQTWKTKEEDKGGKPNFATVINTLIASGKEEPAKVLKQYVKSDPDTDIRGAMRSVAEKVFPKQLRILAHALGLKDIEVDVIRHDHPNDAVEQNYQVMLRWLIRAGSDATIQKLATSLSSVPELTHIHGSLTEDFLLA